MLIEPDLKIINLPKIISFVVILLLFTLSGCGSSHPDGFSEYGFYVKQGDQITKLYHTHETYKMTPDVVRQKILNVGSDFDIFVHLPGFTDQRMLLYKAKPWNIYPRDPLWYTRQSGESDALRFERKEKDLYKLVRADIPDGDLVGITYFHNIDVIYTTAIATRNYDSILVDALKNKSLWSNDKTSFAKQLVRIDFDNPEINKAAKLALNHDQNSNENIAYFNASRQTSGRKENLEKFLTQFPDSEKAYELEKELGKSPSISVNKLHEASKSELLSIVRDYVVLVNSREYIKARKLMSGRERQNLSSYEYENRVLQSKVYTTHTSSSKSATLISSSGQGDTHFNYVDGQWLINQL